MIYICIAFIAGTESGQLIIYSSAFLGSPVKVGGKLPECHQLHKNLLRKDIQLPQQTIYKY